MQANGHGSDGTSGGRKFTLEVRESQHGEWGGGTECLMILYLDGRVTGSDGQCVGGEREVSAELWCCSGE